MYFSAREATRDDDDLFECFQLNTEKRGVVHVDGFIGRREGDSSERDIISEQRGSNVPEISKKRVQSLCKRFKFGSLKFGMEFVYCGGNLVVVSVLVPSTSARKTTFTK